MSFNGEKPYDPTASGQPPLSEHQFSLQTEADFYPAIDFQDFIAVERVPREYREETIQHHLHLAMLHVHRVLNPTTCAWWREHGYTQLADVPAELVNGRSALMIYYREAVYSLAKCTLLQEYATMNREDEAENAGKDAEKRCPELTRRHNTAIAYLTAMPQGVNSSLI